MVFHCTAYPNIVFTSQVLSLASSRLRGSNVKKTHNVVHCALGNLKTIPSTCKELDSNSECIDEPIGSYDAFLLRLHLVFLLRKINKARIVKEGVGITFFAWDYC